MSVENRTDRRGPSSEPHHRMINYQRTMLASLCIVIITTDPGLLFLKRTSSPTVQQQAASSPAATSVAGQREAQEARPGGPALAVPGTATRLRQLSRKGIARLRLALRQSPASAPVGSQSVFRAPALQPVAPQRNPVFSMLRNADSTGRQASLEGAGALRSAGERGDAAKLPSAEGDGGEITLIADNKDTTRKTADGKMIPVPLPDSTPAPTKDGGPVAPAQERTG